jgi:hypothetical protein
LKIPILGTKMGTVSQMLLQALQPAVPAKDDEQRVSSADQSCRRSDRGREDHQVVTRTTDWKNEVP